MGNKGTKKKLIEVLADPKNEAKIRAAFAAYDKDGNGYIDRAEAAHVAQDLINFVTSNSQITKKDLLQNLTLEQYAEANFRLMDKDNSGEVSYEEFKQYLQEQ